MKSIEKLKDKFRNRNGDEIKDKPRNRDKFPRENAKQETEESAKVKIKRLGRTLNIVCWIARIFFVSATFLCFLGGIICILSPSAIKYMQDIFQQNTVFILLKQFVELGSLEPRYVAAIGCTIMAVSFATMAVFTEHFQKLIMALIGSERPFTKETAKKIRHSSFVILLTMLYNPILGLIIFLITLLFSYLVDYGAYIQEKADATTRIQEEMIVSFAEITENKSGQTGQHVRRVSEYARILSRQLGFDPEEAETLRLASTMHDIGKLLIPGEILEKPGKLTDEEYAVIKKHTSYGGQLLANVEGDVMRMARTVALEHHERPDGRGYPLGKTDISMEGKIVAVADVYDALTSRRSYKEAWEEDRAYQEIVKGSGTQFDAKVVKAFQDTYEEISQVRRKYQDEA